jgi:hypothetical protein
MFLTMHIITACMKNCKSGKQQNIKQGKTNDGNKPVTGLG